LSPSEEERLAELPPGERAYMAHEMNLDAPYRGSDQPSSLMAIQRLNQELDRTVNVVQAWILVVGFGIVVAAGLVLGATFIPQATHDTAVRIAGGFGLLGLVVVYFGLAAIYLGRAGRRLPERWEAERVAEMWHEAYHRTSERSSEMHQPRE
jgi:hypothetical protein